MAFTTKAGNPTTIQGTDQVDVLSSVDLAGNFIVRADEAADIITLVSTKEPSQITDVSVYGQDGVDTITSPSAALFRGRTQGGEGNDNINYGTLNTYKTYGGADNDSITAVSAINSTIQGSKGNDSINGGAGTLDLSSSKVYGGSGNDFLTVRTVTTSTVQGSAGNDTIALNGAITATSKVNGGADNDSININAASSATKGSTINGNKGADRLLVAQGADVDEVVLYGGSGNDIVNAVTGQTTISGDLGVDTIRAGTGDDVSVSGGDGNDIIFTNTGSAVAVGNTFGGQVAATAIVAADTAATSSVNGGAGRDTINIDTLAARVGETVVMQGRTDSVAATAAVVTNGGNALVGATVIGNGNEIVFGAGVDVLTGFETGAAAVIRDQVGAELTTTIDNLTFVGRGVAGNVDIVNGATAVNATTWGDVTAAGQTTVITGIWNANGRNEFIANNTGNGVDFLIVQGDGSGLLANTSMMVMDNDSGAQYNVLGFGGATIANNGTAGNFTTFSA